MNPNPQWNQGGYQQPQQTGYGGQPIYPQQTGYPQQQQQRPPPPPLPQPSYSFLSAPPTQSQFSQGGMGLFPQATGWAGAGGLGGGGGGLQPQMTGWQGQGALSQQRTGFQGQQPLVPQPTGYHDPRVAMMSSSFMPQNLSSPYASSGMPVFQRPNLPAANLSSSMNLLNQNQAIATPKIPWTLTKDEKKNYDQIFRAWDSKGTGFIAGETAQEVFGQSGLSRDDMAKIWTLADMDNRGKLNIQEFHVAMGLIYRSLNGNSIPDVLPAELIPASARDLDSNVDFLKNLLKNDTNTRSTSGDDFGAQSYAKSRSFNNSPAPSNSRKDGTVYKHDEDRGAKTYKSSSRHLDRASVRTGAESASDDLSDIKRQLESTSSYLDQRISASDARTQEDEDLDREMEDLRYRVRRVREDIDHVSSGRRSSEKDEERRKLERELLFLSHEKLPDLEKRIEERDERRRRDERDGIKARDRRNDRYGGRFGDDDRDDRYGRDREREREDPDKGYLRGTFERERSRDRDDRSRDRDYRSSNERYGGGDRDRDRLARSPPPAPAPPAHSLAAPPPPAPPASAPSPAPASKNLTPEQRREEARAKAQQKIQDRMRALGLAPTPSEDTVDNSVQERLEREKKEAEEKSKQAEAERAEKESARKARLDGERADRGEPPKPTPAPSAPAPPPVKSALKAAPTPPQPRSALKKPAPPPSKPQAPAPPPVAVASEPEVDPEEQLLKEREERLKKAAAARAARMAEIERQEEEERLAEEQFNARRSALANKSASSTPAPPPVQSPPRSEVVSSAAASSGKHNPFNRLGGGASGTPTASTSSPSTPAGSSNPFFKPTPPAAAVPSPTPTPAPVKAPTPIAAPVARAPPKKSAYVAPPEEDWDVIEDKNDDSDSDSDYDTAKNRRNELARALFGGIIPSSSTPTPAPPSKTSSPAPDAAPAGTRVSPMFAALGGGSADPASRGSLFASIQGGAKLKKAVTKESKGIAGNVIGDAAPPSHISDVPRAVSPPPSSPSAPAAEPEPELASSNPNRQSVDWYQGLAANGGVSNGASEAPALASQAEEDETEQEKPIDPLDAVDLSKSLKVRTLYQYEGQRPEDLSFLENQMIDAHPAKDPSSPWIYGTLLKDRRSGWFPSSYVVEISTIIQAKALYSYEGTTAEELPFTEGDTLTIVDKEAEDWWKAVNDGIVFLVPAAYLEVIDDLEANPKASSSSPVGASTPTPPQSSSDVHVVAAGEPEVGTSPPADIEFVPEEEEPLPAEAFSPEEHQRLHVEMRRAAPPPPAPGPNLIPYSSSLTIPRVNLPQAEDEEEDFSSDDESIYEDTLDSTEGDADKLEERRRREAERLRVLEAAGLVVKIAPSDAPRPVRRRPPPSVPVARRPQSTISVASEGGTASERPFVPPRSSSTLPSSPPPAPPRSPSPEVPVVRVEDAFDRYERFKAQNAAAVSSSPPLPRQSSPSLGFDNFASGAPSPPLPPTSPISSLGGGREGGRLSQLMSKIKTTALDAAAQAGVGGAAEPAGARRPSSLVIGSPMPTGASTGGITRTSTPAMGSNWSSMVGDEQVLSSIEDKERKRQEAMFEFIQTEGSYVRDCQLIVEIFYANLMNLLDDKELVVIFANIEDILMTSITMLSELEERQKASRLYLITIADILAQHIPNVDVYVPYCVQQGTAIRILQSLRESNPTLASQLITLRQQPTVRGMDLSSFLLMPMQRITRYPLLLKQILHYTEPGGDHDKIEYAIEKAEIVLLRINEAIRARENQDRLAALSADLWVGEGRLDLTAPTRFLGARVLVKEGPLMKNKGSKRLNAILTNDLLVLTEPSRNLYRMPLPLNEITLREMPSNSLAFQIVPRFRGDTLVLKGSSAREAMEWMTAIEGARRACVEGEKRSRR